MISEKIPLPIEFKKLQQFFESVVKPLPPVRVNKGFGGWSVLSSNGSYQDGWMRETPIYDSEQYQSVEDMRAFMKTADLKSTLEYSKPTEICTGYLKELVDSWEQMGLYPRRIRFMLLEPGGNCVLHRDSPEWLYAVRLHIPIFTNSECFFEVPDEGAENLKADGSAYLLKVNRMHRVCNNGTTDRVHLIADVYDTKGISQFHQYTKEDHARYEQRKQIQNKN